MDAKGRLSNHPVMTSLLSCVAVSLGLLSTYVALWTWVAPGHYVFLVLVTYWLLGGFALWQLFRAARMYGWTRKLGAIGVFVGLAVTIFLGLRPKTACLDLGPCRSGLTPHPLQLTLGIAVTSASLFLDVRSHTNQFVSGWGQD